MTRRATAILTMGLTLGGASVASAQAPAPTTTSGDVIVAVATGQATPKPTNANSNASISASIARAKKAATTRALTNAQVQAQNIAAGTGLVLGPITQVSQDTVSGGFFGYYDQLLQKLGPNRFCGQVESRIVRRVDGKRRIIVRTTKQCYVPPYITVTLAVTFSASRPA